MLGKVSVCTLMTTTMTLCTFAQVRETRESKPQLKNTGAAEYGSNIISLSPVTLMDYRLGVGLSYEKIFGPEKKLGLVLPLYLMTGGQEEPGNRYFPGRKTATSFYVAPGFKFYPMGQRKLTFAVGPSLMMSYGREQQNNYYFYPGSGARATWLRVGVMLNCYINYQVTPRFNIGMEAGVGMRFINRETFSAPGMPDAKFNYGLKPTGRFALSMGYRF